MVRKMNANETTQIKSFCGGSPDASRGQFFQKAPPLAAGGKLANTIFILLAIMIAFGLKHHYSRASVEDLNWILAPTVEFVELLSGITFEQEAYTGFISKTHRIIIAKSCAGVNFLIIAFCMLIFSRVQATKSVGAKILLFIKSIIIAYFLTIIVNTLRIILAIYLFNADIYGGWLTREMLHRIEGTAIYFIFLCFLYFVFVPRQSTNDGKPTARRAIKTPLAWYLLMTLFIPLVRLSFQGNLSGFFQHSLVVITVLIVILLLFFLFKSIVGRRRGREMEREQEKEKNVNMSSTVMISGGEGDHKLARNSWTGSILAKSLDFLFFRL
jgi:exosortase K